MNLPEWIIIGFQKQDRQDSQTLYNDTFCRLLVLSAQAIIGTEKNPDAGILLNFKDDDYSQGYSQLKEDFTTLTKDDILQPSISGDDFTSSNVRADDVGNNLYVFDKSDQQTFTASQPFKVEFKFDGVLPKDMNGYGLVLTDKLISISSDGNRHFDLLYVIFDFFITSLFSFIVNSVFFNNDSVYVL